MQIQQKEWVYHNDLGSIKAYCVTEKCDNNKKVILPQNFPRLFIVKKTVITFMVPLKTQIQVFFSNHTWPELAYRAIETVIQSLHSDTMILMMKKKEIIQNIKNKPTTF